MARAFSPKVLTASRLLEGDVVYLGRDGNWVLTHDQALLITDETKANALLAQAQTEPEKWVGPYLADANLVDGIPKPNHFREVFRTLGPSNYVHGKQENEYV